MINEEILHSIGKQYYANQMQATIDRYGIYLSNKVLTDLFKLIRAYIQSAEKRTTTFWLDLVYDYSNHSHYISMSGVQDCFVKEDLNRILGDNYDYFKIFEGVNYIMGLYDKSDYTVEKSEFIQSSTEQNLAEKTPAYVQTEQKLVHRWIVKW